MGRPARDMYLIADTGSDVSWTQCRPCIDCYNQSDPIYDPLASTTYKDLPCNSGECNALVSVGGWRLPIPPYLLELGRNGRGGVIVDSGTAVTRFPRKVYRVLRDAFVGMATGLPRAAVGFSLFDTCYDLSGVRRVSVPTVSFEFAGGGTLRLPAANYMVPVDGRGKFCFAFAGMEGTMSIIGNVQQQGTRVVYDVANRRIAFSPNKC
ncbi:Eukaryotic aspartyl protease family protein [Striga hermonthica]|uniref:Eukaryotic aspartyl protease family protein n=1 Tax=Striga hermonthica TaxID=68872 RepID=A0A9N7RA41_STRHE|nr:Eukaryotic aspartyl protease family protein [Striga hermonthica]